MADAEDVAQSVFLRLARGGIDRSRISHLQSYLHRSAVNAALDLIRAKGHREAVPADLADELRSNPSLSPERSLSSLEFRNWLRRELSNLNPRAA
jgi:RNA polymerase sigma factor (sigma-70 family)